MDIFEQTTLLSQVLPSVSDEYQIGINRIGQVVVLFCSLLAIFPDEIRIFVRNVLRIVTDFTKWTVRALGFSWGKRGWAIEFPPEYEPNVPDEHLVGNFDVAQQLRTATFMICIILAAKALPWDWYPGALETLSGAFTVWGDSKLEFVCVVSSLFESVWRIIAFLPILLGKIIGKLIYYIAWLVVTWCMATLVSVFSKNLSSTLFRGLLAVFLLVGGVAIIITS